MGRHIANGRRMLLKEAGMQSAMCTAKYQHLSKLSADTEALRLQRNGLKRVRAYQCPLCHYWHTGHKD